MGFKNASGTQMSTKVYSVDADYIPTLELNILQGRGFDASAPSDRRAVIINQRLADELGPDPIGKNFSWGRTDSSLVIGIVKNFHFMSLEAEINPLLLTMAYDKAGPMQTILVRIAPNDMPSTLEKFRKIWSEVNPGKPFEYSFLDEDVQAQYASYERWTTIITISTIFALIIASVGLFGLAGINTQNRYKEIGIRKALGAGSINILVLLNRRYLFIVIVSAIISSLATNYILGLWIRNFTYAVQVDITSVILYAVVIGIVAATLPVSFHSVKASLINPARILRYE
jgi:putative ABC transport system permease protein